MIIHKSCTGPTHFLSANVWGLVSFAMSVHLRAVSEECQEMLKISILHISLKIINSKFQQHLPGANELKHIYHFFSLNWNQLPCPTISWSSASVRSYSLIATMKMMAVTPSKQWIHFLRSDRWPPTSNILQWRSYIAWKKKARNRSYCPGPCFVINIVFPGMGISIIKMRPSYLYDGNPYTGKTIFILRRSPSSYY